MPIAFYNRPGFAKPTAADLVGKIVLTDNCLIYPGLSVEGRVLKVVNTRVTFVTLPREYDDALRLYLVADRDHSDEEMRFGRAGEEKFIALKSVVAACDTIEEVNRLVLRCNDAGQRYKVAMAGLWNYIFTGQKPDDGERVEELISALRVADGLLEEARPFDDLEVCTAGYPDDSLEDKLLYAKRKAIRRALREGC
jgi:hypothetical protein